MSSPADVTVSAHSLDPAPLLDRPALTAAAGFGKLGLSCGQVRYWLEQGHSLYQLQTELARRQIEVGELEGLVATGEAQPELEAFAFDLAAELGVGHLTVMPPERGDRTEVVASLRRLRERAAEIGAEITLEPLPWTVVPDLATAVGVVQLAGVGICLDVWHVFRHGGTLDDLDACWPFVTTVQLSDGTAAPGVDDPIRDCLDYRLLPGEGEFPLREVLARAPSTRLSVEVLSRPLRARPPLQAAELIGASTHALLTATTFPRSA